MRRPPTRRSNCCSSIRGTDRSASLRGRAAQPRRYEGQAIAARVDQRRSRNAEARPRRAYQVGHPHRLEVGARLGRSLPGVDFTVARRRALRARLSCTTSLTSGSRPTMRRRRARDGLRAVVHRHLDGRRQRGATSTGRSGAAVPRRHHAVLEDAHRLGRQPGDQRRSRGPRTSSASYRQPCRWRPAAPTVYGHGRSAARARSKAARSRQASRTI